MRVASATAAFAASSLVACFSGNIDAPIASVISQPPITPSTPNNPNNPNTPNNPQTPACTAPDPGRVTVHRLNRAEFDNTVRDLLLEDARPAADFPPDDHGFGFDNNADVLATSPLLVEKYAQAAEDLVTRALDRGAPAATTQRFEAEVVGGDQGGATEDAWNLYTNGVVSADVTIATAGAYTITVRAWAQQAGPDPARMEVRVDGQVAQTFDVPQTASNPALFTVRQTLRAGGHTIGAAFINDFYQAPDDRNLFVDYLELAGPEGVMVTDPAKRARVMVCDPAASTNDDCARQIFAAFGRRAWRRPLAADELDRLVALARVAWMEGDAFDVGVGLGLQGILLSPKFTFRVEVDPDVTVRTPHPLTDHELAARLSYFLWSSMPDDALSGLADRGELSRPEVLAAEVRRMIRDPKARALTENFAGQWLYTRALDNVSPDYQVYPSWSAELGRSMRAETEAFFQYFLTADASALDMLDADFTFVDDRLAAHYGLSAPGSTTPVRVPLAGSERGGLFTQASLLTVTSHAKRTSPVKRGKWVLENILCSAPPAPPPGVEGIPEQVNPNASLRTRFEQHRSNPTCAGCHATMDPIGFSLEHFDGVGAFREKDSGYDIDDSAQLPDGRSWSGARGLATALKTDPRASRCMTEKMFVYALGRGPTSDDRACGIPAIEREFAAGGHRMEQLVTRIVSSPAFTTRRAEGN